MAGTIAMKLTGGTARATTAAAADATTESRWVRYLLIGVTLGFLALFLLLPLVVVFAEALRQGWAAYGASLADREALSSIRLTLIVAAIVVPINSLFGIVAAWAIAKFQFVGKTVLITLIDLPYSVSPVISGMIFVLLFGRRGPLWPWLQRMESISCSRCRASCWQLYL